MDPHPFFEIQRWDFDEKHWETMKPGILVRFVTTGKLQTASKIKLRLQMCGDLVWMRRESPGQGFQSRKGTSFISSRRSLHRSS